MARAVMQDITFLKRLILKRRSHVERIAIGIALIAGATGLRWQIDQGLLGVPFTTYYPAIMLAAVLLDWPYALVVTIAGSVVINRIFLGPGWFSEVGMARLALFGLFALSSGMLILTGATIRRLLRNVDELLERQAGFNLELQHRIKNSLAIVQAMAAQGARSSDPAEFYPTLSSRIAALAKANELLTLGKEQDGYLPNLAEQTVAPFNSTGRFRIEGPPCSVPQISCIPLVMALHELCTNAVKHGALSVSSGTVDISWHIEGEGASGHLVLNWQEKGGPPVSPPEVRGLGSRLLVAQKGIAAIKLEFPQDGVCCEMQLKGVSPGNA